MKKFLVLFFILSLSFLSTLLSAQRPHPKYEPDFPKPPQNLFPCVSDSPRVTNVFPYLFSLRKNMPYATPMGEYVFEYPKYNLWRNEKISGVFYVTGYKNNDLLTLSYKAPEGFDVDLKFVRYVQGGKAFHADIIDDASELIFKQGTLRGIYYSVKPSKNVAKGTYKIEFFVNVNGKVLPGAASTFSCNVNVNERVFPDVKDWKIHLDLWQTPQSLATYYGVPLWSDMHFAMMKPHYERLAAAGQKVITCEMIDDAWDSQSYTLLPSMIRWVKKADGTFTYDYTIFDRWVSFMISLGIKDQINCYTMIPWHNTFRYFDEASGNYQTVKAQPADKAYEELWAPFLVDFQKHLESKNWLSITKIAMDERPDRMMYPALEIVKKYAPQMGVAMAANAVTKLTDQVEDFSIVISHYDQSKRGIEKRRQNNLKSTIYVCCNPAKPNTFTFSDYNECEWLAAFAGANRLNGFLRWAYDNWNANPMMTTDYIHWSTGDCFMVYPQRSSLRMEYFINGIRMFEKINILRDSKVLTPEKQKELESIFVWKKDKKIEQYTEDVKKARELIDAL